MDDKEAVLHQRILQEPEADAPRRDLAQILSARGDPRGEFITLQLRIAEIHRTEGPLDELATLTPRERQLASQYGAAWEAPVRPLVRGVTFRRGFIEGVEIGARDFLEHGATLYGLAPILLLRLKDARGAMAEVCASALLERIVALDLFAAGIGDEGAQAIAGSPHLGHLAWLDLRGNELTPAGLTALGASSGLPRLRWLALHGNHFEDPADRIGEDDENYIHSWLPTELGQELERHHGRKAWLHFHPRKTFFWPPSSFAFVGAP